MRHLRVLEDCGGAGFGQRLGEVSEVGAGLLPTAEGYPGARRSWRRRWSCWMRRGDSMNS